MLNAEAIQTLLRAGEGETLEFKERFGADVIETAVAFANTRGGSILISVRDKGRPTGGWAKSFCVTIPIAQKISGAQAAHKK